MKPWYITNPTLYHEIEELISAKYSSLHVLVENETVCIRGTFPLFCVDTGREIDRYWIEIQLPHNFPKSVPIVFEVGGRIPKTMDRHFQDDGSACLFVIDERWKYFPEDAPITDFIDGPVYQFFLSQTNFELTGKWPFGERGHGVNGILEYYSELLETTNPRIIVKFVEYLTKKKVKGHWNCFCASGRKLRDCHFDRVLEMRGKIPRKVAQHSLQCLRSKFGQ